MKSPEKLRESYDFQREIFERKASVRRNNRSKTIAEIEAKIAALTATKEELEALNEKDVFESFDSFRLRAEHQSTPESH